MTETKAFCENCGDAFVDYIVKPATITFTNRAGETYTFAGRDAFCAQCGEPVWVDDVEDFNVDSYSAVVCRANNLITAEQFAIIPAKYCISTTDLASVLGVAADYLQRAVERSCLDRNTSDLLMRVYSDPLNFIELLESGKERLSEEAYARSRRAAEVAAAEAGDQQDRVGVSAKLRVLIQYLIEKHTGLTPDTIQMILYYVQGFSAVLCGDFCLCEDCAAEPAGPAYPDVCKLLGNGGTM